MTVKKKIAAKRVTNWDKVEAKLAAGEAVKAAQKAEDMATRDHVRAGMGRTTRPTAGATKKDHAIVMQGTPSEVRERIAAKKGAA